MSKKENNLISPSSTTNYAPPSTGGDGGGFPHGECCDECKKTCKRNFWTTVLQTIVKVGTAVLAAFGLAKSGLPED